MTDGEGRVACAWGKDNEFVLECMRFGVPHVQKAVGAAVPGHEGLALLREVGRCEQRIEVSQFILSLHLCSFLELKGAELQGGGGGVVSIPCCTEKRPLSLAGGLCQMCRPRVPLPRALKGTGRSGRGTLVLPKPWAQEERIKERKSGVAGVADPSMGNVNKDTGVVLRLLEVGSPGTGWGVVVICCSENK